MKKYLIILFLIFVFSLDAFIIIFLPNIKENRYIKRLKKEVSMVDNYINENKGNINDIIQYINENVTNNSPLEHSIDSYLSDILSSNEKIKNINYNKKIDVDFSKDDVDNILSKIINNNEILNKSKIELSELDFNNYIDINNKVLFDSFNELIKDSIDINHLINRIDSMITNNDEKYKIFEYLTDNKDYYSIEDKIIFTKRSKYNEFNDFFNNLDIELDYELIKDKIAPIINANNIVINEGDYLTLSDKFSCIDEVDDDVTCDISGSYNSNVVGVYTINISAKDSSGNASSKDINIIVKEKPAYTLPYVIEVVRNQSTTIVYGQDENGEYTKIVGVFPCSPGAGTNTPVGTFYSRRGYEWGALFGGVYGQYSTIITGHVLFHSVPYRSTNKDDLIWKYYNRLGSKDSMGCVRLTVKDAKWIYDNCPNGTMIKIYDGDLPAGISKPEAQKIDENDSRRGWDPTDPDPSNPWNN